ncbi:hypothetical protein AUJ77_02095 [Candidatus Nomurabacteria bacterium CG1_02_43_90]|uniref:DUF8128 domain-containing protein n=1 Tax=Candidatus Nomurabacteria bacterium CG1_02_43_90 TaxID=1805281 RepID=A0A1J4V3M1_9BACT|nr:MAG: hypothetical protein AUJ77_02095 [Candidatus Nomurabacteria bacterium CG1_02_43_90]
MGFWFFTLHTPLTRGMIESMNAFQTLDFLGLYNQVNATLLSFFALFPYWAPIILGTLFWRHWVRYVQARYISNINWVILEIKIPRETNKSPLAMEIALGALFQGGKINWYDKYRKGKVRDWFSLEMVSIEGQIRFFIRTSAIYKNVIEAQLYAQYPDVEIYEVPDYSRYVDYQGKEGEWEMIGAEYKLSKADPYPIKTYIDYGLDKDPKEEFKIDPLTSVIEYLGSAGKGEQVWIQIIVQAADTRYTKKGGEKGDWKDEGKEIIDELTKRNEKTPEGMPSFKMMMTTKGEGEIVAAIERSMGKLGFDVGIRALYLSKKDKFNPSNIKALGGLFRAFNSNNLNGFRYADQAIGWDYPWQDYEKIRITKKRKEFFEAYKYRAWFHDPRKLTPFVLTTEELATVFHFPGGVAQTPTFGRISSRKSEAPVNLPI